MAVLSRGPRSWALSLGRLEQTMAEAGIDPASITVLALTHTHQDHLNGLLTRDGRVLFPNLKEIAISEAAVEYFRAEPLLAQFQPLLRPIQNGEHVTERLRAVALPGHAPGHTGYAFDTEDDHFLFFGDVIHVPTLQFANPAFSWGYDDDQPTARTTRLRVFQDTAATGTWIAGAHLGRPGIGRVVRKGKALADELLSALFPEYALYLGNTFRKNDYAQHFHLHETGLTRESTRLRGALSGPWGGTHDAATACPVGGVVRSDRSRRLERYQARGRFIEHCEKRNRDRGHVR